MSIKEAYGRGAARALLEYIEKTSSMVDAPNYGPAPDPAQSCMSCKHFDVRAGVQGYCVRYDFAASGIYKCSSWKGVEDVQGSV